MPANILYIVPPTGAFAGIERVIDEICSELADRFSDQLEIDVLHMSKYDNYTLGDRRYNKIEREVTTRTSLVLTVRRVVSSKSYDLVVVPQVEATALFWLACLGLGRKFVLYLHGNPRLERSHAKAKLLFKLMHRFVLDRLAGVFGTSPRQLRAFRTMFPSTVPHFWIPNPVRKFDVGAPRARSEFDPVTFVNVGRFSHQKGQDILLRSFAIVHKHRSQVRLCIVGYGDGEPALRRMIAELGLERCVSIEHHPENPQIPLSESDVYVSSSRWEGWSLAICEALRFGLPVVATDCEFGPSDILTDQKLGRLVPDLDESKLAEAMLYYCDNIETERLHGSFRERYVDRFSVENVVPVHADALLFTSGRLRQTTPTLVSRYSIETAGDLTESKATRVVEQEAP